MSGLYSVECEAIGPSGAVQHALYRVWLTHAEAVALVNLILNPAIPVPGAHWDTVTVRAGDGH